MRDEWKTGNSSNVAATTADSRSSQGLTRRHQIESSRSGGLDRSASLTLAARGKRLKPSPSHEMGSREVSERRQVGDAESLVNMQGDGGKPEQRWWRNVGMEEGL
jgi:hypothetical protein